MSMLLALALLGAHPCGADTATWLKASETPTASLLLGTSPHTLSRPTLPSTFAAEVGKATNGGALPGDWAIEVAPWWLVSHPNLTLKEYLDMGPRVALDNLAISFATGTYSDEAPFETALGFDTALRWGDKKTLRAQVDPCLAELTRKVEAKAIWISDQLVTQDLTDLEKAKAEAEKAWDLSHPTAKAEAEAQQETCMNLLTQRRGLALDLAGGVAVQVPGMNAALTTPSRMGIWLTPAWLGRKTAVSSVAGMFRDYGSDGIADPFYRTGLQLLYMHPRVSVAPEGTLDLHPQAETRLQGRVALSLDLQVTSGLWVMTGISLGLPLDAAESLGTQIGFQYSSGSLRGINDPTAPLTPGAGT